MYEETINNSLVAANFLKGIANVDRLIILCNLIEGELCVTDLVERTGIPQTSMSQHLAKLKKEEIVDFRRDHRTLYYFIKNKAAEEIIHILHKNFCSTK